ncbi:ArnT family glycosyltransferase [bacterium]
MKTIIKNNYLIILLTIAGILNCFLVIRNPNIGGDSLRLLIPIHNLFKGFGYTYLGNVEYFMPPGYGILSYLIFLITSDVEFSAMLVSSSAFLLIIIVSFKISELLFNKKTAMLTSFFIAFNPVLLKYSYVTLSTLSYTLFLLISFGLYLKILLKPSPRIHLSILLGISLGFTYLIRGEAFLISIAAISFLLINEIIENRKCKLQLFVKKIFSPIIILSVFLTISLPYILFLQKHTGEMIFSSKGYAAFVIGERVVDGQEAYDKLVYEDKIFKNPKKLEYIKYFKMRGKKFGVRIIKNIKSEIFVLIRILFIGLIPLLAIFVTLLLRRVNFKQLLHISKTTFSHKTLKVIMSFIIFTFPVLMYALLFVADRYLLSYGVIFIQIISYLIYKLLKLTTKDFLLIFLLSLIALSIPLPGYKQGLMLDVMLKRHAHMGLREAGLWLKKKHKDDLSMVKIIVPRKFSVLMFYVNDKSEPIKGKGKSAYYYKNLDEISSEINSGKFNYLVLDSNYIQERDYLIPLWKEPSLANNYKLDIEYQSKFCQIYSSLKEK